MVLGVFSLSSLTRISTTSTDDFAPGDYGMGWIIQTRQ